MADRTPRDHALDDLIDSVLEGTPSDEQLAELNRRLVEDPAVATRLIELSELHVMAQWLFGNSQQKSSDQASVDAAAASPFGDIDRDLLNELIEQAMENRRLSELAEQAANALRAQQAAEAAAGRHRTESKDTGPLTIIIPRSLVWSGLAAAVLLVGLVIYNVADRGPTIIAPPITDNVQETQTPVEVVEATIARIVRTVDPVWQDAQHGLDVQWSNGQQLQPGVMQLVAGYLEIELDRGARVFVEGPARVELLDDNHLKLSAGRLVAYVPPSATGFIVDTPTSRLVDIGTEFGVDCDAQSGQTTVQVFQGEVKAAATRAGQPIGAFISLLERDAVEIQSDQPPVPVAYQEHRFVRNYASVLIQPQLAGDAEWLADPPVTLKLHQLESPRVRVMLEKRGLVLEEDLRIDFVPNEGWPRAGIAANTLRAGTRVDVYLVHLDGPGSKNHHAEAQIDFGRPVLGGIGDGARLYDTDALLGHPQLQYPGRHPDGLGVLERGIDLPTHDNDRVWIDRTGTRLHLAIDAGYKMDQFRVLVFSADQTAAQAD